VPPPRSAPSRCSSRPRTGAVSVTRHDGLAQSSDSAQAAASCDREIGRSIIDPAIGSEGVASQHGVVLHRKGDA
jgi:hypothetical protein